MNEATGQVREYLKNQMNALLEDFNFYEGVYSHLSSVNPSTRVNRIKGIWSSFIMN